MGVFIATDSTSTFFGSLHYQIDDDQDHDHDHDHNGLRSIDSQRIELEKSAAVNPEEISPVAGDEKLAFVGDDDAGQPNIAEESVAN
ncbi:uncharacterized protein Z519_10278 [Cladophialophora bantiana CBS 173.52]|uniref:Uncharacterized protein n=1 Tax=Cladophialophora bantiana (strain ATCC 10958 / CBS 173.52 / CDC B-1940 / NIH 8579) TaxID=1442370 RepID=A0A0D2HXZ4_CLAB1|nr:uncharacterized protein Z519_10278 [Cladophialophora bantiana CBS 173.52]KIW89424.1 hypothetical protein Z519_10278 [Cladophialophora bantiana CBS 173.52]